MALADKSPQTRDHTAQARQGAGGGGNTPHGAFDATRSNASPNKPHHDAKGRFIHYCEQPGCGLWGAFGFGFRPPFSLGRWFCAEHAKQHQEKPKAESQRPVEARRATSDKGGQGRLF